MTWDNTYMSVLVISMEPIIDLYSLFVEEKTCSLKPTSWKSAAKQTTAISKVLVQRSQRNDNT